MRKFKRRIPTHHKPSAGMPGPEGPAHRGWLGVVTGIRLIYILAAATAERHGGFLVKIKDPVSLRETLTMIIYTA